MKKSILLTLTVILIAILCYMLYNYGKKEGQNIKRSLMEQLSGDKTHEGGNKRR